MEAEKKDPRKGAVALGLVGFGGYGIDYAFNLGLTRFLTAEAYGDFKLAYSFALFCGLAVLLGGDRAAPMVLSPCLERRAPRQVWEYLRFYLRNALLLSAGLILLTWTLSFLHVGSGNLHHHHPLAWVVVAVPLNALGALVSRTLQSARRNLEAALPWRVGLPLLQLGLFAVVIALRGSLTVYEAILIAMVASAVVTGALWLRVRSLGLVEVARDRDFGEHRVWLTTSLPMMGSFLVAVALNQSDLYFLELLGDEKEVGHYAAAALAAHFIPLIQVTVIGLIAPAVRPALDGGAETSRTTLRQALQLMLGGTVPLAVGLLALGGPLVALFGPQYRVGHGVLRFLVIGNLAWATAALSSLWLQYQGRGIVVLAISVATLVVDSLLNLALIPRYGMLGAAAGTALTLTAGAVAVVLAHRRSAF